MENPTYSFRETNLVLKLKNKSKTMMSLSSRKKKNRAFLYPLFFRRNFFQHLRFISMYSVLNTLSECTYFYISKNINLYTFCFLLILLKAFRLSLSRITSFYHGGT